MSRGQYKTRGDTTLVIVAFCRNTASVDEITYRKMGYAPDFADLPWEDDYRAAEAERVIWL